MLKVHFFLNEPNGNLESTSRKWRPGADYPVEIETTSKLSAEYRSDEWMDTELPCAPAMMFGDEVVAEGSDVKDEEVVNEIRK